MEIQLNVGSDSIFSKPLKEHKSMIHSWILHKEFSKALRYSLSLFEGQNREPERICLATQPGTA